MTYADNIVAQWNAASAADLATGLDWYEHARTFARSLGLDDETGAGVVAALSPMNGWSANMTLARGLTERYLAGEAMPTSGFGLRGNVLKAWRILDGQDPLDVLRGQKVTAFYANIMGDPNAVTVDRWAARIARGDPSDKGLVTAKQYREMADAYRDAADRVGVTPRELQAAVWTHYRKQHARAVFAPNF
jgi:hypothetical protein